MINPDKININDIPKIFCDGGYTGHSQESFVFILFSGNQIYGFMTVPSQMKALIKMFNTQLEEYEKKFGTIPFDDNNQNLIISPFQKR